MKQLRNLMLALTGLFALPAAALAQDAPNWYDIEVIIFSQESAEARTAELWPEDPGRPELENAVALQPAVETETGLVAPYSLLPEAEWRLQAEFNRLKRNAQFTPLRHLAWRQPVVGGQEAQAIRVHLPTDEDGDTPARLDGLIKVRVNRYLHVDLDLVLQDDHRPTLLSGLMNRLPPIQPYFRLTDSRRMRSGELHYIDHPMMGALILINRYALPEPEEAVVKTTPESPALPDNTAGAPALPAVAADPQATPN